MRINMQEVQAPLRSQYRSNPAAALVTDHAHTISTTVGDPLHSSVEPMPGAGVRVPVGLHRAIGGQHDAPTPGDILCAALAACQDSAIRVVANMLGIELQELEVSVEGDVDVRGTMGIENDVPVGFQEMRCSVRLRAKSGTDPKLIEKLKVIAERCCVVQQTLKAGVPVRTAFDSGA